MRITMAERVRIDFLRRHDAPKEVLDSFADLLRVKGEIEEYAERNASPTIRDPFKTYSDELPTA